MPGNRGNVYGNYGIEYPEQFDIVGVAEPIPIRNERYMAKHNIAQVKTLSSHGNMYLKERNLPMRLS